MKEATKRAAQVRMARLLGGPRVKDSTIYRRAAADIIKAGEKFYGAALDAAGQPDPGGSDGHSPLQVEFTDLFHPVGVYWRFEDAYGDAPREAGADAALMLCLMADIVQSEGR